MRDLLRQCLCWRINAVVTDGLIESFVSYLLKTAWNCLMQTILHDIYLRLPLLTREEKEMLSISNSGTNDWHLTPHPSDIVVTNNIAH